MGERQLLSIERFAKGANTGLPSLDERLADSYAAGSRNLIIGAGKARPWKGLQSKGANTGSRKSLQVGSTWGGIKDIGALQGSGSFFEDIGRARFGIGAGQPSVEGIDMSGFHLSTILQIAIAVGGVYDAAHTYDAGLPQSSTPDVAVLASPGTGYEGLTTGPVSFKIARLRLTTGARSVASLTSAVLVPTAQSIRITFPLPSTGQTHWRVFSTQEGFGGVGLHYALRYGIGTAGVLDIPESVVAAGVIDGIPRSLEFDFHTGDLIPELAYIDDYPPPAGTHAMRIENVMLVLGAVADSSSAVSSTNAGTVGSCSLPNFYESHKPDHRIYFPEGIVDCRQRQTDSYGYIACRNGIFAAQYVGPRDGPAVALTTILPDVGISKPSNWCQVAGLLYMRVGDGSFIRMRSDGSFDYAWAADIYESVKNWDDTTVIAPHFDSMSVIVANGTQAFQYSLLTESWSPALYFVDAGVSGTALSAVNSRGQMIMTITSGGAQTAYSWDTGATEMWITSQTPYRRPVLDRVPRSVRVRELQIAFETDNDDTPLIISINRNLRQTFVHDAISTNGSSRIDSATGDFTGHDGDMVAIFGTDVGGSGIDYLIGRISLGASSSPSASPSPSASVSASPSVSPSLSTSVSPSASASRSPSASISRSPSTSASSSVSRSPSSSVSRSPSASPSAS